MIKIRRSLAMKLSIIIVMLALPVFLISMGVFFVRSQQIIHTEATKHVNSVLHATANRIEKHMGAVETAAKSNQWIMEDKNLRSEMLPFFSNRIQALNRNVFKCTISTKDEASSIYDHEPWYAYAVEYNKPSWVAPSEEKVNDTSNLDSLVAYYYLPLLNAEGSFAGVMSAGMKMSSLAEVLDTVISAYPHAYFMLIGSRGEYLVHPDSTKLLTSTIFNDKNPRTESDLIALGYEMTSGESGNMQVKIDGKMCLVCYCHIADTDWSLAIVCPDSDILNTYHKLTNIVLILVAVGFIIILLLARHTVGHVIYPLGQLLGKLQRISRGNYETHIPRTTRADVIGRLQNSFAIMLQSLNFHLGSNRYILDQTKQRNKDLVIATQKMSEAANRKTLFIQNVTHQIRTPLNIILGFAQVMRDSISHAVMSEEEAKTVTQTLKKNAYVLQRMVLMLFDSSDEGAMEELKSCRNEYVACKAIAEESINYTYNHFPNLTITLNSEVSDTLCIFTNRIYLMRSIRELLYNAAKYSDGKNISLSITETVNTVYFIVQDTGPGISEVSYDDVFMPFTKIDDLSEGLGLGLPLAKRHAISLGGNLTLDTDYHKGCRFFLSVAK